MDTMPSPTETDAGLFLDTIYEGLTGYCYIATKDPKETNPKQAWEQFFYKWPEQKPEILSTINKYKAEREVYYGPAIFKSPSSEKSQVKYSKVLWCEFDGRLPEDSKGIPEPTIKVLSSVEGHEHWYWLLEEPIEPYDLEHANRAITYELDADASGWDAGQVLRPIGTYNHKRKRSVELITANGSTYSFSEFDDLPEPPPPVDIPEVTSIPEVTDVVMKYPWPVKATVLFKQGIPDRSAGLMSLGYYCAEMQMTDEEIFSILLNADERWGKFKGRSDQYKRLMEIVVRSRLKYPQQTAEVTTSGIEELSEFNSLGVRGILATEVNLEWIWEGLFQVQGNMVLTGPAGVGKTQFTLDACARFILGKDFLGRKVHDKQQKIGFFSLEMGVVELKEFLKIQASTYTNEELDILEQRLRIFPLGTPIMLNNQANRDSVRKIIEKEELTGIAVDSLGMATEDDISQDVPIRNLFQWLANVREETGCFSWFIHHHRKASVENKKPNTQADVFGSGYIVNLASTVLCLWPSDNKIQVLPLKLRMAKEPPPFFIKRMNDLKFANYIDNLESKFTLEKPKPKPEVEALPDEPKPELKKWQKPKFNTDIATGKNTPGGM